METLNRKILLTNSHCDTPIYKGVLKNWHKKDAYLSISVKRTVEFQKMITQTSFCFDFLLLYLHNRGIIQTKTLNTMCYRLLEVGHWNIKIL